MKFYLLVRRGTVGEDENERMVVRAESREEARLVASKHNRGYGEGKMRWPNESPDVWLTPDPERGSTCEAIDPEGPAGVVACVYNAAERRYG